MKKKILLTPEMAKSLLDHNYKANRTIIKHHVARLAMDIDLGNWNPMASYYQDPLIISDKGELLNGQHRCMAVIKANKPIEIYAECNADESIFEYLDINIVRKPRDYIDGPNKNATAALAKLMCATEDGTASLATIISGRMSNVRGSTTPSRTMVVDKAKKEAEKIQHYINLGSRAGTYLANKKNPLTFAFYIIDFVGRGDDLDRFVYECAALVPVTPSVIALRAYFMRSINGRNFKATYRWVCSVIFAAYEAYMENREIKAFSRLDYYFTKYDEYVKAAREEKRVKR